MKYLLKESQVNEFIYEFIDDMFETGEMSIRDYDYEIWDGQQADALRFYYYDEETGEDNEIMKWYNTTYWDTESTGGAKAKEYSPIVDLEDKYSEILDNLFGQHWHPIFLKWFESTFHIPVKTVGFKF